jgi:hypothetical protein
MDPLTLRIADTSGVTMDVTPGAAGQDGRGGIWAIVEVRSLGTDT